MDRHTKPKAPGLFTTGLLAGSIGLAWYAMKNRDKINSGVSSMRDRVTRSMPHGMQDKVHNFLPMMKERLSEMLPASMREQVQKIAPGLGGALGIAGAASDEEPGSKPMFEQAPVVDELSLRDALRSYSPASLASGIVSAWPTVELSRWHEFGTELFHALQGVGVGNSMLTNELQLSTNNVYDMHSADFAKLLSWTQQNHPDVLYSLLYARPWAVRALGLEAHTRH